MEVFPVTADTIQPPNPAPRLEYAVYFARAGTYDVDVITSPTLDVLPRAPWPSHFRLTTSPCRWWALRSATFKDEDNLAGILTKIPQQHPGVALQANVSTPENTF